MASVTKTSLGCPECGAVLLTVHIGETTVDCPKCGHVMFTWRAPGEYLTQADLNARRQSHYTDYIRAAQKWLRVEHRLGAGLLVSMIFHEIGKHLPKE